jgi:D-alanyl-D-alanine carboxypeptidase/D-alanyl-D-alanine-endopeptidase (penicillin-binding protein 4)
MGRWGGFLLAALLWQDGGPPVDGRIEALLRRHGIDRSRASILVGPAGSRETLYACGADRRLIPASTVKLVTTAWALTTYGESSVFRTRLYVDGRIREGILEGDLVVRAGGDPNISGRFFEAPTSVFERWKKLLGVRKITGSLVLVDERFEKTEFHPDWEGNDVSRWYCAPVRGFGLNDNCVDLTVSPGSVGQKCRVRCVPDTRYVTIDNGTKTVSGKPKRPIAFWRRAGTNRIFVRGELGPRSGPVSFSCTIQDPTRYFGTVLLETLGLSAPIREADRLPESLRDRDPIDIHEFDLKRTLQVCNRRSQNLYAEMLFKGLGGGSWDGGAKGGEGFLRRLGAAGILRDGSGLSRKNRLCARDVVSVLRAMFRHETFEVYRDSLAAPGDDGTLRKRMKELKGRVRAKTGHLGGISALSGYVTAADGSVLVFSVIVNGKGRADSFQNDLCRLLANLKAD